MDPPAEMMADLPISNPSAVGPTDDPRHMQFRGDTPADLLAPSGNSANIAALLNQFAAAGFQNGNAGGGAIFGGGAPQSTPVDEAVFGLTKPHG